MTITVLYFGELREQIQHTSETVTLPVNYTVAQLIADLIQRGDPWSQALSTQDPLRVAVNQEMAQLDSTIPPNAEVALFRPVTGG